MKYFIYFLCFVFIFKSYGQKIAYPLKHYTDSTSLKEVMPILANQIKHHATIRPSDLLQCQITLGEYTDALKTLESISNGSKEDSIYLEALNFKFKIYALAKIQQEQHHVALIKAYETLLPKAYNELSEKKSFYASWDSYCDVNDLRHRLNKLLNRHKENDNIDLEDAIALCAIYNTYTIYTQTQDYARRLIRNEDNKKFIIEDSILVKTIDHSTISATVVRKRGMNGQQPAILMFSIYSTPKIIREAAEHGYACVVAYTRGKRYSTDHIIEPFEHDGDDAYAIIDWISKQTWSNGKVGMLGGSYLGFSQWAALKSNHPALKTIVPMASVGPGVDFPMQNNVFSSYALHWLNYVSISKDNNETTYNDWEAWDGRTEKWYASGKSFSQLDSIEGPKNIIFHRWLQHPAYDDYWKNMTISDSTFSTINIPILTTTGYYDADVLGAMNYFKKHYQFNKNPAHYLLIGPYDHAGAQGSPSSVIQGYKVDSAALNMNIQNIIYQWFDYILKDSIKPEVLKNKINYQVMGTNQWKNAPSLEKMNNDTLSLYLTKQTKNGHYFLDKIAPSKSASIKQKVDFKNRKVRCTENDIIEKSLYHTNGKMFISAPFKKSFEINGSFLGQLIVKINKKDMDVCVDLYELLSDGNYFKLSSYLTRASYSKDRSKRQLLHPGELETILINNSTFTSRKINAGSKLVVVVSINKNPWWQINYGTGKDVSDENIEDAKTPLKIKWYNYSVIKIPVLLY